MNRTPEWLHVVAYRLGQVRQQLGFVTPLSIQDKQEVQRYLPTSALALFDTMSNADQQHCLRVCRSLQAQGCIERDMLAAALLHDVGKAQGRVPFWTRPVIVLGKLCAPRLLVRVVIPLPQMRSLQTADKQRQQHKSVGAAIHCVQRWGRWGKRPRNVSRGNVNPPQPIFGRNELLPLPSFLCSILFLAWRRALSYAWWHAEIGADLAADAGLSERAVLYIRTHHEPNGPAAALHRVDEVS